MEVAAGPASAMRLLIATVLAAALFAVAAPAAAAGPPAVAAACSGCHAASADALAPVPRLIGMKRSVMVEAMQAFRAGKRPSTIMDRIAKGYSDDEIQTIADWYAKER